MDSERYLVVSSDCHAGLRPEEYRPYLDPQYREAFDEAVVLQRKMAEEMSKVMLVEDFNQKYYRENAEKLTGAWDPDVRARVLDEDGIAAEIIFPDGLTEQNTPPFGAGLSLATEGVDPERQWAGARAHNRWLSELCRNAPERHIGLAVVPALWDVEVAVKEVRWARENGLRGILIPPMWGKFPPYNHPRYEPLWNACVEHDLVVHFHSGPAPMQEYFTPNPDGAMPDGAIGIYTAEVCWWLVRPLTFMIGGGVFERHPKLRVAVTEGSCIWVTEYLELLDHRFGDHHAAAKLGDYSKHLSLKPSEYFRRNIAVGASVLARREVELRDAIGQESILWGSDYPHPEGTWPATRNHMRESLGGIPEDDIAAMLGGNAVRFYGLDAEKLAPLAARIGPEKALFRTEGEHA